MKKIVDMDEWNEFYKDKTHRLIQYEHYDDGFGDAFDVVEYWLEAQPDAEEKRGKWIYLSADDYRCSNCDDIVEAEEYGNPIDDYGFYYCPTCGAKMDLGK